MAARVWTVFDLVCLEYPEIRWEQDTVMVSTYQGDMVREVAAGPLRAVFHDD